MVKFEFYVRNGNETESVHSHHSDTSSNSQNESSSSYTRSSHSASIDRKNSNSSSISTKKNGKNLDFLERMAKSIAERENGALKMSHRRSTLLQVILSPSLNVLSLLEEGFDLPDAEGFLSAFIVIVHECAERFIGVVHSVSAQSLLIGFDTTRVCASPEINACFCGKEIISKFQDLQNSMGGLISGEQSTLGKDKQIRFNPGSRNIFKFLRVCCSIDSDIIHFGNVSSRVLFLLHFINFFS